MYDLVIVGGGPGGLCAGIYATRLRLKTILVERELIGGQIALTDVIENYPGFPSISGMALMEKFEEHARSFGLEIKMTSVESITTDGADKVLQTTDGEIRAKAVILATGAKPSRLGVPNEVDLTGKGVSYCATCDGPFFRNLTVMVVGGGDTALKEANFLAKIASKVYLVHRRDQFRGEKIQQEKVEETENIEILRSHILKEIQGDKVVEGVVVEDLKTGESRDIALEGVFIFVGIIPTTGFVDVDKDAAGFIISNSKMETSEPGIFVAGDCRDTPLLQVATAVGDGAISAYTAEAYIESLAEKIPRTDKSGTKTEPVG
jgi:thioredoxin reductase (NADPH)